MRNTSLFEKFETGSFGQSGPFWRDRLLVSLVEEGGAWSSERASWAPHTTSTKGSYDKDYPEGPDRYQNVEDLGSKSHNKDGL